jgi:hypothetical protein
MMNFIIGFAIGEIFTLFFLMMGYNLNQIRTRDGE